MSSTRWASRWLTGCRAAGLQGQGGRRAAGAGRAGRALASHTSLRKAEAEAEAEAQRTEAEAEETEGGEARAQRTAAEGWAHMSLRSCGFRFSEMSASCRTTWLTSTW